MQKKKGHNFFVEIIFRSQSPSPSPLPFFRNFKSSYYINFFKVVDNYFSACFRKNSFKSDFVRISKLRKELLSEF